MSKEIKKFVDDLNWVNNVLHDFATRVAFIEITEQYMKKYKALNMVPMIMCIYNSMANDAVLKINNIYDHDKNSLSIFYLLNWIRCNTPLIKSHVHSLDLTFSERDITMLEEKINKSENLILKFEKMRNKLVGHNDKKIVNQTDIRRRLLNNKNLHTKEQFLEASGEYIKEISSFLLEINDFIKIKDITITVLNDIKKLLKMPDRIFGNSGNEKEWKESYESQQKNTSQLFDSVLVKSMASEKKSKDV